MCPTRAPSPGLIALGFTRTENILKLKKKSEFANPTHTHSLTHPSDTSNANTSIYNVNVAAIPVYRQYTD
jgi:hypothetical protein